MLLDMEDGEHCLLPSMFLLDVCVHNLYVHTSISFYYFCSLQSVLGADFSVYSLHQCCLSQTGTQALQRYGSLIV